MQVEEMRRAAMRSNVLRHVIASAVCGLVLAAFAPTAEAQVTGVNNYTFSVPLAKVVPNPCSGGFTLVNGTISIAISAVQQTTFQLSATMSSSGSGKDVTAAGLPLILGALPDYSYSSSAGAVSTFSDGVPSYFEHTLRVTDFLVRNSPTLTGDSYVVRSIFRFKFNNGIPAVPVLETVAVACE
jgi:hypothetical protein